MKKRGHTILIVLILFGISNINAQNNIGDDKFNEFDFWVGEWNVYKHGTDTLVGYSKIESIIDDKVIKETYHSSRSKYHGTSLNKYNPRTDQWEQFWVDNTGLTLHIKGNIKNGKMVLQNEIDTKKGVLSNKISWVKNIDDTVRQTWLQSSNQGKTWTVVFDGDYKPKQLD
ncbi:hypothetical protein [Aquimarina sp. 2201CG14-23]|uniref:hypothetical protein n=1 Tax=Aquimarina mycalae TaxID=3040073 RepID=UPI002477EE55|nr:hypothetical protein [Aquimarina sp. 2201CG14-23]MDH7444394.1 hypothetical protein [Aquimarina sp. 2201CG14-23]